MRKALVTELTLLCQLVFKSHATLDLRMQKAFVCWPITPRFKDLYAFFTPHTTRKGLRQKLCNNCGVPSYCRMSFVRD